LALAHREEGEKGYFMAMISPTLMAKEKAAAAITSKDIVAKDVVFCVDTSYSMTENGKIIQAKKALAYCIKNLRKGDRFNIVDFSTEARTFSESGMVEVNARSLKKALRYVDDIEASGGTAIHEALTTSIKSFGQSQRLKMIMFMTDGLPTIGERDPQRILKDITAANKQEIRMFVFGAGYNVNARMLDMLALDNRGDSDYILPREDIAKKISRFFDKVGSPVMTDLKVKLTGIKAEDVYPRQLSDLFKGEQVIVYGRYSGEGTKTITLTGKVNGEERTLTYNLTFPKEEEGQGFVPRLWGGQKVSYLLGVLRKRGESKELIKEVVHLSKRFGIVTPYTAYLVTQDVVRPGLSNLAKQFRGRLQNGRRLARGIAGGSAQAPASKKRSVTNSLGFGATRRALKAGKSEALADRAGEEREGDKRDDDEMRKNRLERRMKVMRYVGSKTFYSSAGVWYDSAYDAAKKQQMVSLTVGSERYFKLVAKHRGVTKYLALGNVCFRYKGVWYKMTLK